MTTSEPNDHATPGDRRATTADLSWMLWTAIGIGAIWIAVLLISLLAPNMVSGSEQQHLPVASFVTWFWGGIGTLVLLGAMGRLRGSSRWQPSGSGCRWRRWASGRWPRFLPSRCPCLRPGAIRRGSPSPPCSRRPPRRCSRRWRAPSPACSVEGQGAGSSPEVVASTKER